MAILHLVLLDFKPEVPVSTQLELLQEFIALPQKCRDTSQNLYIKGIRAGSEYSPSPAAPFNRTHLFVLEFGSVEQREYYKPVDPVHADFASRILPCLGTVKITAFQETTTFAG